MVLDSRIYIVNSSQRISDSSSSNCNFKYKVLIPPGHNYDRVCVLQAIIPKSYYLVQTNYNYFTLREGATSATVTIPAGNYNVNSFITIVTPLINTASPNGWTYSFIFPNSFNQTQTGKYTFTVTGHTSQPSFIFDTVTQVFEQFGFNSGTTNTFSTGSLTSTNVVKFQVEDVIYLHSDICDNSIQNSGDNTTNDVLQEIYGSSTPDFSNIVYENFGSVYEYSKKLSNANNGVFNFNITNENNVCLDLNGLNMVFTLLIYKRDDETAKNTRIIKDIIKDTIQYSIAKDKINENKNN